MEPLPSEIQQRFEAAFGVAVAAYWSRWSGFDYSKLSEDFLHGVSLKEMLPAAVFFLGVDAGQVLTEVALFEQGQWTPDAGVEVREKLLTLRRMQTSRLN